MNSTKLVLTVSLLLPLVCWAQDKKPGVPKDIKSYCLDFNWGEKWEFAKPGTWKDADPSAHVAWYKTMGAIVIQTFCISTNGYAWYKNGVVPEQPGLKHDFLRDVVKLGHKEGMVVVGYFCIGSNTRWGTENPDLSYGVPSAYHIPYTDEYLAYLSSAITDAVKTTGIDGFMIDWLWQPKRQSTNGKWIDAEKKLYSQLMGEEFPGEDQLKENSPKYTAYSRKALDRCWKAIRKAAKDANPTCIIWLTTNKIKHPHLLDSDIYREVDWILNEAGSVKEITQVKPMVGKDTHLITCFADWNGQDASKVVPEALAAGVGLYGFAKPDGKDGLVNLDKILPKQLSELSGNIRNIGVLARAYRGKSMDSEWANGGFAEPAVPSPFHIEFRPRKGWQDTARITRENDKSVIAIRNPYQSGRGQLTRAGANWPSSIVIQLLRKGPDIPGPTHFRLANGKLGVSVTQLGETKVVAGVMQGGLDLKNAWQAQGFLNGGKPESPIQIDGVEARTTGEFVEVVVPAKLLERNPETLAFEWCNGEKVR